MKNPWVLIGIITVVLFGGAIWLSSQSSAESNEGVEIKTHVSGNPDAEVVLVEYSDLQCPACASFHPVVKEVLAEYGDNIRFEYKHFPLPIHRNAFSAAMAAEAAGQQGEFFAYHDLLFENQSEWAQVTVPGTFFVQYAEELELDIETFKRHQGSSLLREQVQADLEEGRDREVSGTPSFFLNGERMEFQTFQEFIEQIAVAVNPSATSTVVGTSTTPNGDASIRFGI